MCHCSVHLIEAYFDQQQLGLNPSDRTNPQVNFSEMSYTRNKKGEERCKSESIVASSNWKSCVKLRQGKSGQHKCVANMAWLTVCSPGGAKSIKNEEKRHLRYHPPKSQPPRNKELRS